MFLISFFTGSIIRMFLGLVVLAAFAFVACTAVVGVLAATGSPGACTPGGGPITIDPVQSESWQTKWDALSATLGTGQTGSTTFTESELSSRAEAYLQSTDVGFQRARICVHDGYGEGSATFDLLGIDIDLRAKGTVDLDGDHPKAELSDMEVGSVPGWLTAPFEDVVNRAVNAALDDATLSHDYTAALTPGQANLNGTP